jgi:hypothetical protein
MDGHASFTMVAWTLRRHCVLGKCLRMEFLAISPTFKCAFNMKASAAGTLRYLLVLIPFFAACF